jgi:glycosyltransferase involved in cell wall biosynthesis
MDARNGPRVVLVHDWLTGMRGGEKCLEAACRRWPRARLLTLLHRRGSTSPAIEAMDVRPSALQRLPGAHRYYRYLLPLMPLAAGWRAPACDLVVSFSHCVAKSARAPEGVPHVCYCFTPMRYAWHLRDAYFRGRGRLGLGRLRDALLARLRAWDRATAGRVSHFIAISRTVQRRIRDCYGRDSAVVYPPVDTEFYRPAATPREDYYLAVSALAPYKRLDLAVTACRQSGRRLVVVGSGQDERRLRRLAGPGVTFLGWRPNDEIREHLRRCRALLFPGEEDFGIVPVEAMACGAPVIAYQTGGATETVLAGDRFSEPTGLFFAEQSPACVIDALERFERRRGEFSPAAARQQALRFNSRRFEEDLFAHLDAALARGTPVRRAA